MARLEGEAVRKMVDFGGAGNGVEEGVIAVEVVEEGKTVVGEVIGFSEGKADAPNTAAAVSCGGCGDGGDGRFS